MEPQANKEPLFFPSVSRGHVKMQMLVAEALYWALLSSDADADDALHEL